MRSLNKTLETEVKSALRRGGNDTLNIYFMDATPYLGAPSANTAACCAAAAVNSASLAVLPFHFLLAPRHAGPCPVKITFMASPSQSLLVSAR